VAKQVESKIGMEEAKPLIKALPSQNPDDYTVEKVDYENGGHNWAIYFDGKLVGNVSSGYKRSAAAKEFVDSWNRRLQHKEQDKQRKDIVKEKKLALQNQ
jgi:hypothetical protein